MKVSKGLIIKYSFGAYYDPELINNGALEQSKDEFDDL